MDGRHTRRVGHGLVRPPRSGRGADLGDGVAAVYRPAQGIPAGGPGLLRDPARRAARRGHRHRPGRARVRALGTVDAVFDAAGTGVLADAISLAGGPGRVITLSDPAAVDYGVMLSQPSPDRAPGALDETIALLAEGRLRLRGHTTMAMRQAAEAHRQLESGNTRERIILTLE
ncbi:MAG TPA: zinc-binding dehydrogenase [Streptosporangiaceae bacterium]